VIPGPLPEGIEFETLQADSILWKLELKRQYESIWVFVRMDSLPLALSVQLHPGAPLVTCDSANPGIVLHASEEARALNIHPEMSLVAALSLFADLAVVTVEPGQFADLRLEMQRQLSEFDPNLRLSGIVSATLNITAFCENSGRDPIAVSEMILASLNSLVDFPFGVGVANSKIAAAMVSQNRSGISVAPETKFALIDSLGSFPVAAIPAISPSKISKLQSAGIENLHGLIQNRAFVPFAFGQSTPIWLFAVALGIDLPPFSASISVATSFESTVSFVDLLAVLRKLCLKGALKCQKRFFPVSFIVVKFMIAQKVSIRKVAEMPFSTMEFSDIFHFASLLLKEENSSEHRKLSGLKLVLSVNRIPIKKKQKTLHDWLQQSDGAQQPVRPHSSAQSVRPHSSARPFVPPRKSKRGGGPPGGQRTLSWG
jgi:nucleotidyltransferase/DNA polymerase involved in DNA repair